jgi:hypothetical protein
MLSNRRPFFVLLPVFVLTLGGVNALGQGASAAPAKSFEISPAKLEVEVGQKVQFSVVAKDATGKPTNEKTNVWFATPFDLAGAGEDGTVTFYQPGEVMVGALVGGRPVFTSVTVKPAAVKTIEIEAVSTPLIVGGTVKLRATPRVLNGDPRNDVALNWSSDNPSIATVDAAGVATGLAPGKVTFKATTGAASSAVEVNVVKASLRNLSIQPRTANARTGDVIRFNAIAQGSKDSYAPRWGVSGEGAAIEPDGAFVAELPGNYVVTATIGEHVASASIVVAPRSVEREVDVIGRALLKDVQGAEQWIIGNYAYYSTISDRFLVYDISSPANPKLTDTIKVDARIINDIATTPDGKILVISREGASNRKNGIAFYDTSDPAHPKLISEYTATVTGGVHSAFVDSHYVYLTDDSTGSMRVIDFADVKSPKEVARWQVETPVVTTVRTAEGEHVGGRYLHDVYVKDGLAYLAYWRDGLIILDVGNGIKGGSPEKPQVISQFRFNHNELYGNGWLAGAHAVYRYKNYVFVGDEVFPGTFQIHSKLRIPVRGIVHVIDVSDINQPRKVAEYAVPEAGAHNIWVDNDVLYMGYYNGGARILDVSGELRGDLYRQGREIARLWTGDPQGFRPNLPFAWGAQPHKDMIFFNDINSGLWIVKIGAPIVKGSTTTPGR